MTQDFRLDLGKGAFLENFSSTLIKKGNKQTVFCRDYIYIYQNLVTMQDALETKKEIWSEKQV